MTAGTLAHLPLHLHAAAVPVLLAVSPTRMKNMDAQACHHSELIHILSVTGTPARPLVPAWVGLLRAQKLAVLLECVHRGWIVIA